MAKRITWVGIDNDKRKLTVAVLRGSRSREPEIGSLPNEDRAIGRWVRRLERESQGGEIRMCYEAGPNGFALKRPIKAVGEVIVEVMAPSLTPRRSGQRVKTDPLDAKKLVQLFRSGELCEIAVPNASEEAARDLVRTHHQVITETTRKWHHILKFLLRRGRIYLTSANWTQKHRQWLQDQKWDDWKEELSFEELTSGLRDLEDRRRRLLLAMNRLAKFGLQLHGEKTRLIEFGHFSAERRMRRKLGKPETFGFLGFTHYWARTRAGRYMVLRKTQWTRVVRKLKELRENLWWQMHRPVRDQHAWLCAVLRGHYGYFGITDNSRSLNDLA